MPESLRKREMNLAIRSRTMRKIQGTTFTRNGNKRPTCHFKSQVNKRTQSWLLRPDTATNQDTCTKTSNLGIQT